MNQTEQLPFENVTVRETRKGLDFDSEGEEAPRIFFERVKAGYVRDRHLIPGPAQIILDVEIQSIEDFAAKYGYSGEIITRTGSFIEVLLLVREMMALQKPAQPLPAGGIKLRSFCQN